MEERGQYPERITKRKNPEWEAARTTDGEGSSCSSRKSWTGGRTPAAEYAGANALQMTSTRESMRLGPRLSYPSSMSYESRRLEISNPRYFLEVVVQWRRIDVRPLPSSAAFPSACWRGLREVGRYCLRCFVSFCAQGGSGRAGT